MKMYIIISILLLTTVVRIIQLKEKERRMRQRAEKAEEQRIYQQMKLRRMQERAHAGPCKTVRILHQ